MQSAPREVGRPIAENPLNHRINMSFDSETFTLIKEIGETNNWSLAETVRKLIESSPLLDRPVKVVVEGREIFISKAEATKLLARAV